MIKARRNLAWVALAIAMLLTPVLNLQQVFAATGGGQGLSVSPVTDNIKVTAGSSSVVDIYVHNVTQGTLSLQGIVDDFTAGNNEQGIPQINFNGQELPQHGLKKYVQPISNFIVDAGATQTVPATIKIPSGTPAGGYYGLVRFAPSTSTTGGNVNLSASVGTLILVTVPGNYKEDVSISSFGAGQVSKTAGNNQTVSMGTFFTSSKNIDAVVKFDNLGDVQEQPFGKVELKNGSKVLASYEVNEANPPGNVLPSSIREFNVPLTKLGTVGRYTIEGYFGYGSKGQLLTASASFYVVPVSLIVAIIVVIILIILGIVAIPRWIRAYNRKIERRVLRSRSSR